MTDWMPWFAWRPVWVDAYFVDELRRGQTRYRVWLCRVEYQRFEYYEPGGFPRHGSVTRYRLPQRRAD